MRSVAKTRCRFVPIVISARRKSCGMCCSSITKSKFLGSSGRNACRKRLTVRVKCIVFGNTGSVRCTRITASTISAADVRTSAFAMTFTCLDTRTVVPTAGSAG